METISNSILTVDVSAHGAELQSIRKDGQEYLWQGDARFWGRRSPVLFPTVGRVWDNQFRHAGNVYEMGQHGFARDTDFQITYQGDDGIVYWLESTPDTLGKFPFPFRLMIGYLLEGNRLHVKWRVENRGALEMPFQIGAHPAFYLPNFQPETELRGYFALGRTEHAQGQTHLDYLVPVEKGCTDGQSHPLTLDADGLLPITPHTFDCDTYIFDRKQLNKVTLLGPDRKPHLSLEFDTPLVALWSPTVAHPDCPFVCIEPWYGRCDRVGYTGEWKDRECMQILPPKGVFDVSYTLVIE